MRSIEVSIGLIQRNDTYLLQRRPDIGEKGAAGFIGAFGGTIEEGESPLEAVCRELSEETSLRPSTEDFKELGNVTVISDRDNLPVRIAATVFRLVIASETIVTTDEGELVEMTYDELQKNVHRLTPATKAAFEQLT